MTSFINYDYKSHNLSTTRLHLPPCNRTRLGLRLLSSLKLKLLRQTTYTTGDSCDGGISVLNHCLSWSKFVNTHLITPDSVVTYISLIKI